MQVETKYGVIPYSTNGTLDSNPYALSFYYDENIKIGSGTRIGPSVNSNATLQFTNAKKVSINVAARWYLGANDRFTMGYADKNGYHDLLKLKRNKIRSGRGSVYSTIEFSPKPSGAPFLLVFGVITDSSEVPRSGAAVDYLSVTGCN